MQFVQFLYKKKTKFPVFSIQHLNFSVKRKKPKKISEKMGKNESALKIMFEMFVKNCWNLKNFTDFQ